MAMHMGVWLKNLGFLFAKHGFRANGSRVVGMDVGIGVGMGVGLWFKNMGLGF